MYLGRALLAVLVLLISRGRDSQEVGWNGANPFGLLTSVGITVFIVELLRRRILREKYAVLWLLVCVGLVLFSVFLGCWRAWLICWASRSRRTCCSSSPLVLLLVVSVQLSYEVSRWRHARDGWRKRSRYCADRSTTSGTTVIERIDPRLRRGGGDDLRAA